VPSKSAATVSAYLDGLPAEHRKDVARLRTAIRKALPPGFEETIQYGMISYVIPLKVYPETYNGQPLAIVSLASHKNYMSLYLSGIYGSPELRTWFERAYAAAGKKLDMGKSCLRFKRFDDLALGVIAEALSRVSVDSFIAMAERARGTDRKRPAAKPAAKRKRRAS
jgi:hypothetical protein